MFGSETLDVAIGLSFLFFLVSLICSSMKEALETVMKYRARDLQRGIRELLGDQGMGGLVSAFYQHPLINALYQGPYNPLKPGNLPSYIPSQTFSLTLLDLMSRTSSSGTAPASEPAENRFMQLRSAIAQNDNTSIKGALLPLFDSASGDIGTARRNIEDWYNAAMDRVSGWYKRRTQIIIAFMGLFLCSLMNIDSIGIARYLNTNGTARSALLAQLQDRRLTKQPSNPELIDPEGWLERQGGMPVGWLFVPQPEQSSQDFARDWRRAPFSPEGWLVKVSGILLTTFAITLGAPFWFDLLNKIMVVRSTVKPQEKSAMEKSKD